MQKWCVLFVVVMGCSKGALAEVAPDGGGVAASSTDTSLPPPDASVSWDAASTALADADGSTDAGPAPQPLACANGSAETEPNDAVAKATPLVMGRNCGASAPGDVDFFALPEGEAAMLRVESASADVRFALVDDEGLLDVELSPEGKVDFQSAARAFVRVTAASKQSYAIILE